MEPSTEEEAEGAHKSKSKPGAWSQRRSFGEQETCAAMASTKKSNLPPMIDSRFTEKDLNDVFTFEFEKPKFGLLGKAKKKSATCKVEKEVNGELKPCSFKTSEASAMKSLNLWRHVKRNHPENYALPKRTRKMRQNRKLTQLNNVHLAL
ncbi:hypothetical protein UY3_03647 [Chelonia mydas]|uniref:Uncharacterized protein n=1 Tax=Chelonia mydas TaxID=8469 RepID=M7CE96_CHEMY|nr:hypothetical protein UY3_03647 [Chelonia mydas]